VTAFPAFLTGVIVGAIVAGLIALNLWHRRNPMTPEDRQALEDDMRIW
jgi:hypothetical protein